MDKHIIQLENGLKLHEDKLTVKMNALGQEFTKRKLSRIYTKYISKAGQSIKELGG